MSLRNLLSDLTTAASELVKATTGVTKSVTSTVNILNNITGSGELASEELLEDAKFSKAKHVDKLTEEREIYLAEQDAKRAKRKAKAKA